MAVGVGPTSPSRSFKGSVVSSPPIPPGMGAHILGTGLSADVSALIAGGEACLDLCGILESVLLWRHGSLMGPHRFCGGVVIGTSLTCSTPTSIRRGNLPWDQCWAEGAPGWKLAWKPDCFPGLEGSRLDPVWTEPFSLAPGPMELPAWEHRSSFNSKPASPCGEPAVPLVGQSTLTNPPLTVPHASTILRMLFGLMSFCVLCICSCLLNKIQQKEPCVCASHHYPNLRCDTVF